MPDMVTTADIAVFGTKTLAALGLASPYSCDVYTRRFVLFVKFYAENLMGFRTKGVAGLCCGPE